jgi:cytochrome P450
MANTETSVETGSPFDLDPEALRCPFPYYERLRAEAPVTYVESIGAWVVSRYDDIRQVLGQVERFSNRYPTGPRYAELMRNAMGRVLADPDAPAEAVTAAERGKWQVLLTADPPLHDRQRKLVNRAFTPRQIARAEPQVVEIAERLLAGFAGRGEVELVSEFSWPLPLEVIASRLGVPTDRLPTFKRWSDDMAALVGNHTYTHDEIVGLLSSQGEFYEYFTERLAEARVDPQDDVLGKVATAEMPDGDRLSEDEMLGMLSQFLVAGNETTTNLISSAMLRLAEDPGLADELRSDLTKVPNLVEEVLRLESPSQGMFRRAKEDVEIGGVRIPAGDHVFLAYASANADESAFPCPHDVDLDRTFDNAHLAFGHGTHYCLGAPLARQEARIAITLLLDRLDDIAVAAGAAVEPSPSYFLHGLKALPLTFRARG